MKTRSLRDTTCAVRVLNGSYDGPGTICLQACDRDEFATVGHVGSGWPEFGQEEIPGDGKAIDSVAIARRLLAAWTWGHDDKRTTTSAAKTGRGTGGIPPVVQLEEGVWRPMVTREGIERERVLSHLGCSGGNAGAPQPRVVDITAAVRALRRVVDSHVCGCARAACTRCACMEQEQAEASAGLDLLLGLVSQ